MMRTFIGKGRSIATRLFITATLWSTVLLLAAAVILVLMYRRSAEQTFDSRLQLNLAALVADISSGPDEQFNEPGHLGDPQFDLVLSGWYWQVTRLRPSPDQMFQSVSLSGMNLPPPSDAAQTNGAWSERLSYVDGPDGRRLRMLERIIDVGVPGTFLIQVAATTEDLEDQIRDFKVALGLSFILLALALVGTIALQVRYGLRPLRQLQSQVASIRRGKADRIDGAFTVDLAPLAEEVNLLIASNREVVERARTQVGNLAHALKTPLSVITNDADQDDSAFAAKVREQVEVMREQLTVYLDRARAAARSTVVGSVTDVDASLSGLLRTFTKIYGPRAVRFSLTGANGSLFRGEKQDFEEMVGNLLDNAGKWANSMVAIKVNLDAPDAGFLEIVIDDDGPGLSAGLRREALTRGRRLDETRPGSGLGLSIARDLALSYTGQLSLGDSPHGGLQVRLSLPSV